MTIPFNFAKKPKKPTFLLYLAKVILCRPELEKRGFTYEKIDMEGISPPYLLLSTHGSMVDFHIMLTLTHPHPVNNVMTLEGFHDYTEFLMRNLGVIGKRKFIKDYHLIRHIRYCLHELKTVFVLYPEARYSLDGTTSFLPESLGKLCRMMKVPVVCLTMQGNYVSCPQWNKIDKKNPVRAVMRQVITKEETETLSVSEINHRLRKALTYDDFRYQYEQKLRIDHPLRAEGLHALLYQCASCEKEYQMYSKGTKLWCDHCHQEWEMTEYGQLQAFQGKTRFEHIPDWFAWQRDNVRREIATGSYCIAEEVRLETLPNARGFRKQPNAMLYQDMKGTRIEGTADGIRFFFDVSPAQLESMHVEYDYKGKGDCVDLSTETESYWCYPFHRRDLITKLSIATEELHLFHKRRANEKSEYSSEYSPENSSFISNVSME